MRYDKPNFDNAVSYYKSELMIHKPRTVFVYGEYTKQGFYSVAPLSRAAADLGIDMSVVFGFKTKSYEIYFEVWDAYDEYKKGVRNNRISQSNS